MVSGASFRLVLPATSTIRDAKQRVISEQPKGTYTTASHSITLTREELLDFLTKSPPGGVPPPSKVEEIRLLHLGKLLEDAKTLRDCGFHEGAGAATTVHISCRVPSTAMDDAKDKLNKKSGTCCTLV